MSPTDHVLHIVHWPKSGIGVFVKNLIRASLDRNLNVTLVLLTNDASMVNAYVKAGVNPIILDLDSAGIFEVARTLRQRLKTNWPTVVHAHSVTPHLVAFLAFGRRPKYVCTIHSDYPYLSSKRLVDVSKRLVQGILIRTTRATVAAVSERVRRWAQKGLMMEVMVVENGVAASIGNVVARRVSREGKLSLLAVGRLTKEKGFENLIRAVAIC